VNTPRCAHRRSGAAGRIRRRPGPRACRAIAPSKNAATQIRQVPGTSGRGVRAAVAGAPGEEPLIVVIMPLPPAWLAHAPQGAPPDHWPRFPESVVARRYAVSGTALSLIGAGGPSNGAADSFAVEDHSQGRTFGAAVLRTADP
jgi:hypothetical protein